MKRNNAFTFIELLISLSVIAVAFLPLMQMFATGLEQVYSCSDLDTARYLAQEQMERLKNYNLTKAQIKEIGDIWEPALHLPALEINGRKWRILRKLDKNSDPLEVRVQVFLEPVTADKRPFLELTTLIEDLEWSQE